MRTTITIDAKVLDELVTATGERSRSAALNRAAAEYLRRKKLRELKDAWLAARTDDVRPEARVADARRERFLDRLRAADGDS